MTVAVSNSLEESDRYRDRSIGKIFFYYQKGQESFSDNVNEPSNNIYSDSNISNRNGSNTVTTTISIKVTIMSTTL